MLFLENRIISGQRGILFKFPRGFYIEGGIFGKLKKGDGQ